MSIEFPRFAACAIVEMAEGSGSGQATTAGMPSVIGLAPHPRAQRP
jgi:hypothetical protein